ncbi:MAG: ABC-F family ATP-binding cassette domain-containing protein [Flavobacteriales bacterium]
MLNLSAIGVHFGQRTLFEKLDLFIGKRERVGLVGRNGAGKSTLLKIIAGEQNPSEGSVSTPNDYRMGYLPQEMQHNENATILEEASSAFEEIQQLEESIQNITRELSDRTDYESVEYARLIESLTDANARLDLIGGGNTEEQVQRILQGLGFTPGDMSRKMSEFSGGWKMRVELAKLLLIAPDLLLLDEPTNHLDIESIEWLEGFLQQSPSAIVLISHDRAFLDNLTSRTIEITPTKLYDHKASYTAFQIWREEERLRQEQAFKNQQKYIGDTEQLINKFRAKKNKAAFAQTLIRKLDKMERIEVDAMDRSDIRFRFPPAPRSGKVTIEAHNLGKSYGDLQVFEGVELIMARQEKVALVGKNGAGKTTLTRLILGQETGTGELTIGHNVDIGYYAQNQTEELDGNLTVLETLDEVAVGDIRKNLRGLLGSFLFSGEDVDKKVKVLSGGEKARLALCKLLLHPYNLLILDEPTNHLDIRAKDVLKEALRVYDGSLIVVSHDRDFLADLTDLVYEVQPNGLKQYIGDIRAFLHEKHASSIRAYEASGHRNTESQNSNKKNKTHRGIEEKTHKESYAERKAKDKTIRKLKNRISNTEKKIQALELQLKKLEQDMTHLGDADRSQMTEMAYRHEEYQQQMQLHLDQWESDSSELDALEDTS